MVTVNMKDFKKAVRIAKLSISSKVKPILGCVLISCDGEELILSSTNLEQHMKQTIPLVRKGELMPLLIPWESLNEAIRGKSEKTLTIDLVDSDVLFNFGNTSITVKTFEGDTAEFPESPDFHSFRENQDDRVVWLTDLQAPALAEYIRKVYYARSFDDFRFALNGIFLESGEEGINLVATDGHRLSVCNLTKEEKPDYKAIMFPNFCKTLLTVCDSGKVNIGVIPSEDTNKVSYTIVQGQGWSVCSMTIDGQFPLYQNVISKKQDYGIILKKGNLCETLTGIMSGTKELVMQRCDKGLKLTCGNASAIICDVDTSSMITFKCDINFLMEMLFAVDSEWILIQTTPLMMMVKDENSTHILAGLVSKDYILCFFCGKKYEIEQGVYENKEVCSEDCEKALETVKEKAKLLNEKHQAISVKKTRNTLKGLLDEMKGKGNED